MSTPRLQESPIDHHIQAQIIQRLFVSDAPVAFSQLKPSDIENSLFMYHVRKLEDRGIISRDTKGFTLTASGARWANFMSPDTLKPKLVPRLLVSFIITTPDGSKVLLSRRTSAVATHLTQFILPSGFHKYGVPLNEAANKVLTSIVESSIDITYYDTYEIIYQFSDGYVHHMFLPTFDGHMVEQELPAQERYVSLWIPVIEIIENVDGRYEDPLPEIIKRYVNGDRFNHETFVVAIP